MELNEILDLDNEVIKNNFIINKYNLLIWPLIRWDILFKIKQIKESALDTYPKQPRFSLKNFLYVFYVVNFAPYKKRKSKLGNI